MSRDKEIKYDVHVRDGERWTVYTDAPTKSGAVAEARTLLGSGKFDGVKVTEERGQVRELVVFEDEIERHAEPVVTASPVETASVCNTLADFISFDSRRALGRVLRKHLDRHRLTPSELMFDDARIRELQNNETLYLQALQLVAAVQSRRPEDKPAARVDFIERMIEQIAAHCRSFRALEVAARDPAKSSLSAGLKQLGRDAAGDDFAVYRGILFARFLAGARDWEGKLVLLLDQIGPRATDELVALVDEGIAEIFDSAEAVHELLGYQRNTAAGLGTLMQLSSGTYEVDEGSESPLERLSVLIAARPMRLTRQVMIERVARTVGNVQPLTKGDRAEERDAFARLVADFAAGRAFESAALGEALTTRARQVYGDGYADLLPEHAIDQVLGLLENDAVRFSYLLDLCGTEFGITHQDHVIASLAQIVNSLTSIASLVGAEVERPDVIRAAAHIRDRLLSTKLPDKWRLRFAKVLYDLLLDYNIRTGGSRDVDVVRASPAPAPAMPGPTMPAPARSSAPVAADPPPKPEPAPAPRRGALDAKLERRTFDAGSFIFKEGDKGEEAYLINSGRVAILRKAGKSEVVIANAGPGSIIGEMALIDRRPRMASARVDEEAEVTVIPLTDMQQRLERLAKDDPVMRHLVGMFVQRMRDYGIIAIDS